MSMRAINPRRFSWSWTQATTHGNFSQEGTSKLGAPGGFRPGAAEGHLQPDRARPKSAARATKPLRLVTNAFAGSAVAYGNVDDRATLIQITPKLIVS